MSREENLKKLADQIQEMPSKVNPDLWANISSQIGAGAAAGTTAAAATKTGWSLGTWIATSVVGAGAIVAGVVMMNQNEPTDTNEPANLQTALVEDNQDNQTENKAEETVELDENKVIQAEKKVELNDSKGTNETQGEQKNATEEKRSTPLKLNDKGNSQTGLSADKTPVQTVNNSETQPAKSQSGDDFINSLQDTPDPAPTQAPKKVEKSPEPPVEEPALDLPDYDKQNEVVGGIDRVTNVFTPNNDRDNDEFFVVSHGLLDYSLVIMNEKGQVIWKTTDTEARWNGQMMNGQPAPDGTYIYMIAAKDANDNPISASQRLTIKR